MSFTFTPTHIPEVIIIDGKRFKDERGFFSESFRVDEFEKNGIPPFVQENHSFSQPPCLRGLHYQLNPKAQGKLVYCVAGSIIDVAVDIRKGSPNYAKWVKVELNEGNGRMLYIPPGFAHGFLAGGIDGTDVIYKTTEYYSPEHDRCIRPNDPEIGIRWDYVGFECCKMSDKDKNAPLLKDADNNFVY
jgi:dTDP-4-dehydrorhamnose 3,5-epimerase